MTLLPVPTLALVLAGGAGGRLGPLTDGRAKPAVPYGGTHRLIDFPLSNCLHSGINDVWVLQQFSPVSLTDHLANGRPWDLDRTTGGLLVLHPRQGDERGGWHQGTADALWREAPLIREHGAEVLVVVSADAVYALDYADVVAEHVRSGAEVTMVTKRLPDEDVSRYGVAQVDADGVITDYAYKPEKPSSDLVTIEVFVFTVDPVLRLLEELAEEIGEDGLEDLGTALLPRLVERGQAREYRHDGYWRDVGTIDSYWSAHMEILDGGPPVDLDDPHWTIRTRSHQDRAAAVEAEATVSRSVLAPGSRVAGQVTRSVIGTGVLVEAGAVVEDSVLLYHAVVRKGAQVRRAIVDERAEVTGDVGEVDGDITVVPSPAGTR